MSKRKMHWLLCLVMILAAMFAATTTSFAASDISLNKTKLSIKVGDSSTLIASVSPGRGSGQVLTWSSNNLKVASVDSHGVVTARSAGKAVITVKIKNYNLTAACKVTVKEKKDEAESEAEGQSEDESEPETEPDKRKTFSTRPGNDLTYNTAPPMRCTPVNSLDTSLTTLRETEDPSGAVFHILQFRLLQANDNVLTFGWNPVSGAAGYRIFGAQVGCPYVRLWETGEISFKHRFLVKNAYYKYIAAAYDESGDILTISRPIFVYASSRNAEAVRMNTNMLSLSVNKQVRLKMKVLGEEGQIFRCVNFESSDPSVASVSADGTVITNGSGKCTIYAYAQNGMFDKCRINVS